ncbi:MAG: metallophosphoesterase [Nanoarchaeota archaeon]
MSLPKNYKIVDLALQYKDTLIIGDLQLGFETYLHKKGVLVPIFQLDDILERLKSIFQKTTVKKIVINGDVKHEFGTISNQEWRDVLKLFDFLLQHVDEIILVKGNHDLALAPIAQKRNIQIVDFYQIDDVTILHGHKIIPSLSKTLIIGHEHPAISFPERRGEKYKCFLVGTWKKHDLIVLPSFNPLTEGSDVLQGHFLSPFLKGGIEKFEVYVVGEQKPLYFGKVKDLRKLKSE